MTHGRADEIRAALTEAFAPVTLDVVDDSARHAGHAGAGAARETHFNVSMVTAHFAGMSRVERSRRVHQTLAGQFRAGLHALSLILRSPDEINPQKTITPP